MSVSWIEEILRLRVATCISAMEEICLEELVFCCRSFIASLIAEVTSPQLANMFFANIVSLSGDSTT